VGPEELASREFDLSRIIFSSFNHYSMQRVKKLDAEREAAIQKLSGAKMLWQALKYVASIGGGGLITFLLMH
jgi:hypothetical protein